MQEELSISTWNVTKVAPGLETVEKLGWHARCDQLKTFHTSGKGTQEQAITSLLRALGAAHHSGKREDYLIL